MRDDEENPALAEATRRHLALGCSLDTARHLAEIENAQKMAVHNQNIANEHNRAQLCPQTIAR